MTCSPVRTGDAARIPERRDTLHPGEESAVTSVFFRFERFRALDQLVATGLGVATGALASPRVSVPVIPSLAPWNRQ